ncbi:MAG: hypothetical protein K0S51_781 [Bacillales bacterium]|jgi:hypothetical protein|nr:hypothetical protein [Bacillales bacterium]
MGIETKSELLEGLNEIEKWENDQKGLWFWEKLGRLPFLMLDKITPKFIHEKIGQGIDELVNFVQSGGSYLVDQESVLKKHFPNDILSLEDVCDLEISKMDFSASQVTQQRAKNAMLQGGTTGIGGIFTLAIDVPLMFGITLKTLQEIAICYGYNPSDKAERIFTVKCLQFASSDIVGKKAILDDLIEFNNKENSQMISQIQGWREVLMTYRDNMGWKKLFQMIPIAGIIFGAYINKSTVNETAEVAMMLYRKRRILERLSKIN